MKKILLSLLLIPIAGISQNQYAFGFDAALAASGYVTTNQSAAATTATWNKSSYTLPLTAAIFGSGNTTTLPNGQAGGANSFAIVNFNSTTGANTISNWLISPNITVQNGDVVSFYTRKGTDGTQDYPDRLELRMSTAATTVNPSTGSADVGSFTTLGVTVNPALAAGFVYPQTWTQYSFTVTGLTGATVVKFAFRYFVTSGGPSGANSDIIGIDTFSVDRTLGTADFFKNNFTVYPNPANSEINISNPNSLEITSATITDVNGRIVKQVNSSVETVNVSDLNAGVYFLKVATADGSGTTKFLKQ